MKTYRVIELPNFDSIKQHILNILSTRGLSNTDGVYNADAGINMHEWLINYPDIVQSLKEIGLYDGWLDTALVLTYQKIPVHTDHAPEFDYSLNLPISNTKGTYTCFYEVFEDPIRKQLPNGLPYNEYDEEKCKMIDRVEILKPTIINIKTPHAVILDSVKCLPRITIALRMNHG